MLAQIGITFYAGLLAFNGVVLIGTIEATGGLTDIIFNSLSQLSNQITLINGVTPVFDKFKQMDARELEDFSRIAEQVDNQKTSIVFSGNQVSFAYEDKQVFSNLTFTIHQGQKYLIKGPSGCGKSTFLKVLASYLQTYEGDIQYFGQQLSVIPSHIIRDQIMYI